MNWKWLIPAYGARAALEDIGEFHMTVNKFGLVLLYQVVLCWVLIIIPILFTIGFA